MRSDAQQALPADVCAVHAVMLGGESPPSRCAWSRRTREAPGRHREVGSEGSVERMCGARDTNRIRGVVQPGRAGTQQQSPPSTIGLCFINPASMHGRYDSLPREICGVSCEGLRAAQASLTAPQKSADGIAKLLRNFISFYHQRLLRSGMGVSPQHPGSSSVLVNTR